MNNSSKQRKLNIANTAFIVILLAYLIYAGIYIYKTSFVVAGERYFILFDDAMISMRYARNLANGEGLVFNPGGERVEGRGILSAGAHIATRALDRVVLVAESIGPEEHLIAVANRIAEIGAHLVDSLRKGLIRQQTAILAGET